MSKYSPIWKYKFNPIQVADYVLGKTLVSVYSIFDDWCKRLDEAIFRTAVSYSYSSYKPTGEEVCNRIMDNMEKKNRIINIKLIIDRAAKRLKPRLYTVFNYCKDQRKLSVIEMRKELNLQDRTSFRVLERLYEELVKSFNEDELAYILKFANSYQPFLIRYYECKGKMIALRAGVKNEELRCD